MSSELTDLIREADRALDGITPGEWIAEYSKASGHCVIDSESRNCLDSVARTMHVCASADARFIAAAPDLVRRLRDALEASEAELAENEAFINVWRNRTYRAEAALAEANATIERFTREVDLISAHRTDWDDNGPEHDEWLASLGEKRLGHPDIAYRGIQYAVMRLRRSLKGEQS